MTRRDDDQPGRSLSRRALLEMGAVGGALLAAEACAPLARPAGPGMEGGQAPAAEAASPAGFELEEVTLAELQAGMASGRWTAEGLTRLYLDRIGETNHRGPSLRAVIEVNPDAPGIAAGLDAERRQGHLRGPLHGVPILLKDNIGTHDRTTTTAGSYALEGSVPPADSFVARRLREAGAVLLGKANLSEWANFRSNRSTSGWSGRGGQCHNPYVLDRNPCGSSSGSGAATSANLCAAALGTETNGSIVCPSSANGVVGIKPTVGLVSRSRIVPISHSQDTAGPMARTVADAATILGALTGVDPDDPATAASRGRSHDDYTPFLDTGGLHGLRLGVARSTFGFDPAVDALMEEAIAALRDGGAEIVDPVSTPGFRDFEGATRELLLYEFKADLNAYLAALGPGAPVHTLADVIAYNEAHRDREMPFFGQETMIAAEKKGPLTDQAYLDARDKVRRVARTEGLDKEMDEKRLDAILAPTGGPAWVTDLVNGDHFTGGSSTPAAVAGYPNVSVPAGFVFGLPVGISFFGRAWSEPTLIRIAYAFEQATHHRRPPRFLPTLALGGS